MGRQVKVVFKEIRRVVMETVWPRIRTNGGLM
jgi:hypothetical protein